MRKPTVRRLLPALFAAVLAPGLTATPAEAQTPPELDHFKCYRTTFTPPNVFVGLLDQFDGFGAAPQDLFIRFPVKFCTPVEKTTPDGVITPIKDINAHLEMFIAAPDRLEPTRRVVVRNQFGTQWLLTYGPELLAVPSAKNDQPPPGTLDHYKCYRTYGASKRIVLKLRDQFQDGTTATVLRPRDFCNPVEKTHNGEQTKVNNPHAHLLCYTIATTAFDGRALARNQFGLADLPLGTPDMLCVPSEKLRFSIVTP